ncbi:MAG: hypothetical protein ACRDRH_13320 [Pseudonocardia sp.]
MSCRTSGAGSAAQPGGVAEPTLTHCAESRVAPLAVGYLRVWLSDPPGYAHTLTTQLRAVAHRSGPVLADAYTEHIGVPASGEGVAFRALVEALRRPHIHTDVLIMSQRCGGAS